jgi:hypothetical protein
MVFYWVYLKYYPNRGGLYKYIVRVNAIENKPQDIALFCRLALARKLPRRHKGRHHIKKKGK